MKNFIKKVARNLDIVYAVSGVVLGVFGIVHMVMMERRAI